MITRILKERVFLAIFLMIIAGYLFSCQLESKFSVESMSPSNYANDVPLNAAIKIVFRSEGKLAAEISEDNFILSEVTYEQKDETKDQDTGSGTETDKTEDEEKTRSKSEPRSLEGFVITDEKQITVQYNSGPKGRYETTVIFIPRPSINSKSPLEPFTNYEFRIKELKDSKDNTLMEKSYFFKTEEEGFEFVKKPKIKRVITPADLGPDSTPIAKNQELVFEFESPVNPLRFSKYSKLTTVMIRDINLAEAEDDKIIDTSFDRYADIAEKRLAKAEKKIEDLEKQIAELEEKEPKTDEDEKKLTQYENDLEKAEAGLQTLVESIDEGKLPDKKFKTMENEESKSFFTLFLEDFSGNKNQADRSKQGKYLVCNYNIVVISASFSQKYSYNLSLKTSSGGKDIATYENIYVDESLKDYDRKTIPGVSSLTELDFFDNSTD